MESINFEQLRSRLSKELKHASHEPFRKNENNVLFFIVTQNSQECSLLLEKLQKEFADCKVVDVQHDEIMCVPSIILSQDEGVMTPNPVLTISINYFVPNSDANINGTMEQNNLRNAVCFNKDYRVNVLLCHKNEQTRSTPLEVDIANHIHYYPYEYCDQ